MEVNRLNIKSQKSKPFSNTNFQKEKLSASESKMSNVLKPWLDDTHPNFKRWKRGREVSIYRGQFVFDLLKNYCTCNNLKVLDLGSGLGGTSKIFSEKNFVVSYDVDLFRLKNQHDSFNEHSSINGDALNLPFKGKHFDIIILQDMIEHLPGIDDLINGLSKILNDSGIIYISTPNKFSLLNVISDPHWGMPFVSILKRENIKKYFLRYFRKQDLNRKDIAQLFSLKDIQKAFGKNIELKLNTRFAVKKLFEKHKGIIWSSFHLFLLKLILALRIDKFIIKISNDDGGLLNKYFVPTFYLTLKKKY